MKEVDLDEIKDPLWKVSTGTRQLRMLITKEIEALKEKLASGVLLTTPTNEKLLREYIQVVGQIKALRIVTDLTTTKEAIND